MINVPLTRFQKHDSHFCSGENVFHWLDTRMKEIFGKEYMLVGDIYIITTPNGAQKQFTHPDDIIGDRIN